MESIFDLSAMVTLTFDLEGQKRVEDTTFLVGTNILKDESPTPMGKWSKMLDRQRRQRQKMSILKPRSRG